MIWIYIIFPIIGYVLGSIKQVRIINNSLTFKISIVIIGLIITSLITNISFYYDWIEKLTISLGLLTVGYTGTRLNKSDNGLNKNIVKLYRILTFSFYIILPLLLLYLFGMSFSNDWIGETIKVESNDTFKIKHINKNSNFNFPGYHIVHVYDRFLIFEYPVNTFKLGEYGKYGFNSFIIENNKQIPMNEFKYDARTKSLILSIYSNGGYEEVKRFYNPHHHSQGHTKHI
jgi:hypothetical protein